MTENQFMKRIKCLPSALILIVISLLSGGAALAESEALTLNQHNKDEISGHHTSGVNFSTKLIDNIAYVEISVGNKRIKVRHPYIIRNASLEIGSYDNATGQAVMLDSSDNTALRQTLENLLKVHYVSELLKGDLLSTMNLLYSWPSTLPVSRSLVPKSTTAVTADESAVTAAALSESICSDINKDRNGSVLQWNYGYCSLHPDVNCSLVPVKYDPVLVGPYPFEPLGCMGRCGRGCIGDPRPNNNVDRFTQNCLDHDVCVERFGYIASNCVYMFENCIDDFRYAPSCTPVLQVIIEPAVPILRAAKWQIIPADQFAAKDWYNRNEHIDWLPPGTYTIYFTDVPWWNTPQARLVDINAATYGTPIILTETYTIKIDHITITGPAQLNANSTITLKETTYDANNEILAIPGRTFQWTSSDPSIATVTRTGSAVTVTSYNKSGPVDITATERVSGLMKSAATRILVGSDCFIKGPDKSLLTPREEDQ